MKFALMTLVTALLLSGVAEWFSIVGIVAIYAAAPYHSALVLGIVIGIAKLIGISWLYRNWSYSSISIKIPLIVFTLILMATTSMGVFGFLTKAHFEQGAPAANNAAKVEQIAQLIEREKSIIADNEKVIGQLDSAINSYIGKDRTDKAVSIRKSQDPQRKQLRNDISASQKKIEEYNNEKFKLESEVRALEIEVGPIKYISELVYGSDGNNTAKIESAVRIFTLLIVLSLDPLAVVLLIAANQSILRAQNEEKDKDLHKSSSSEEGDKNQEQNLAQIDKEDTPDIKENKTLYEEGSIHKSFSDGPPEEKSSPIHSKILQAPDLNEDETTIHTVESSRQEIAPDNNKKEITEKINEGNSKIFSPWTDRPPREMGRIRSPVVSKIEGVKQTNTIPVHDDAREPEFTAVEEPWAQQDSVLKTLVGSHFVPQKLNDPEKPISNSSYPTSTSWVNKFGR